MLDAIIFGGFETITIWRRFILDIIGRKWVVHIFFHLVTTNFGEFFNSPILPKKSSPIISRFTVYMYLWIYWRYIFIMIHKTSQHGKRYIHSCEKIFNFRDHTRFVAWYSLYEMAVETVSRRLVTTIRVWNERRKWYINFETLSNNFGLTSLSNHLELSLNAWIFRGLSQLHINLTTCMVSL